MRLFTFLLFILLFFESSGQSCLSGRVVFSTQGAIDSFAINYPDCSVIDGIVMIEEAIPNAIINLNGLGNLKECGSLYIENNTALESLDGLNNLERINDRFFIINNTRLADISTISSLNHIGGWFNIDNNGLSNLQGLQNLDSVGTILTINRNLELLNLEGLERLQAIGGYLQINGNTALESIKALSNLSVIDGFISIANLPNLSSISGLENIDPLSIEELIIENCINLSDCAVESVCEWIALNPESTRINGNAENCNSGAEIAQQCTINRDELLCNGWIQSVIADIDCSADCLMELIQWDYQNRKAIAVFQGDICLPSAGSPTFEVYETDGEFLFEFSGNSHPALTNPVLLWSCGRELPYCEQGNVGVTIHVNEPAQRPSTGETFCVDFTVEDFTDVTGIKSVIEWDTTVLQYNTVQGFHPELTGLDATGFELANIDLGRLKFEWALADCEGTGVTLNDCFGACNPTIFQVCYTMIGEPGAQSEIRLPLDRFFTRTGISDCQPIAVGSSTATVVHRDGSSMLSFTPFRATSEEVFIGESVCVPVLSDNFEGITAYQHSIAFDSTILQFDSLHINPDGIPNFRQGLDFQIVDSGTITFLFSSLDGLGVSIDDDVEIYSICFSSIAEGGSDIDFTSTPTEALIFDENIQEQPFNAGNGRVSVITCRDTMITIDTMLCSGSSITINNSVFAAEGSFQIDLKNELGCDSIINLNILIDSVSYEIPNLVEVCNGDDAEIEVPDGFQIALVENGFGQRIFLEPGSYDLTVRDVNLGCTNVQPIIIRELPIPDFSIEIPSLICVSEEITPLAINNLTEDSLEFTWTSSDPDALQLLESTGASPVLIASASGLFTLTVTGQVADCEPVSQQIVIRVIDMPSVALEALPSFCEEATFTPVATYDAVEDIDSVRWIFPDNASITESRALQPGAIQINEPGDYTITLIAYGLCGTDTVSISFQIFEAPQVEILGTLEVCEASTTILTAQGAGSYVWSTGDTTQTIEEAAGVYELTLTDQNGCVASTSVEVTNFSNPTLEIQGQDSICIGETTTISALGDGLLTWSTGERTSAIEVGSGTYTVSLTDANGCMATDTIIIVELPLPDIQILGPTTFCAGELVTLSAIGEGIFSWSTGDAARQIEVGSGEYTLTITDENGCTNETTFDVLPDTIPPEFLFCPSDIIRRVNRGDDIQQTIVEWTEPVFDDNCGLESVQISSNLSSGSIFTLGMDTVIYTLTDGTGNESQCTFTVNVEPSADLTFYVDSLGSTYEEGVLSVPISVTNFNEVESWQFSIEVSGAGANQIEEVVSAVREDNSFVLDDINFNNFSDNILTLVWSDPEAEAITLVDSTTIFTLKIRTSALPDECLNINILNEPTDILAIVAPLQVTLPTTFSREVCIPNNVIIDGRVFKRNGFPIGELKMSVLVDNTRSTNTDLAGRYIFEEVRNGGDYLILPDTSYDQCLGQGDLTVLDLIQIKRHLLEIERFSNPLLWVAADVDASGRIALGDLIEIQDRILRRDLVYENSPEWVFIPTSYVFPMPNPLSSAYPTSLDLPNLSKDTTANFYGIRIGDVSESACEQNEARGNIVFKVSDQYYEAGDLIEVPIKAANFNQVQGYQFGLYFDPEQLSFQQVEKGDLETVDVEQFFGLNQIEQGQLNTLWYQDELRTNLRSTSGKELTLFSIKFRAKRSGMLSNALQLNPTNVKGMVFTQDENWRQPVLVFTNPDVAISTLELLQIAPNPFSNQLNITLQINQASQAEVNIYDFAGKLVHRRIVTLNQGYNQLIFENTDFQKTGAYILEIKSDDKTVREKVIHYRD